jgi:hypothetical protein
MEQGQPAHLYKYRPISGDGMKFVEAALLRGEFKFSIPASFNDPFDCFPRVCHDYTEGELLAHFARTHGSDPGLLALVKREWNSPEARKETEEAFRQKLGRHFTHEVGLFSLAGVSDDILMWSHYADSHRGVSLRFSRAGCPAFFNGLRRVTYSVERPALNPIRDDEMQVFEKALLIKSRHWEYEQEWRYLSPCRGQSNAGPGIHKLPMALVDAVVLGANIETKDEAAIRAIISRRDSKTEVFRAVADADRFAVCIEPA